MSVQSLPNVSETDTGQPDVAHYAHKAEIARAAVLGGKVKALCGVEFEPIRDPSGLPVCEGCVTLRGALQ